MRTTLAFVVILGIVMVEFATLLVVFVPVVSETDSSYSCIHGYTCPKTIDYCGSISFHYFGVGMTYGACGGFQMVTSAGRSPVICFSSVKIPSTQSH